MKKLLLLTLTLIFTAPIVAMEPKEKDPSRPKQEESANAAHAKKVARVARAHGLSKTWPLTTKLGTTTEQPVIVTNPAAFFNALGFPPELQALIFAYAKQECKQVTCAQTLERSYPKSTERASLFTTPAQCLAVSGNILCSGHYDGAINMWQLREHAPFVTYVHGCISPNATKMCSLATIAPRKIVAIDAFGFINVFEIDTTQGFGRIRCLYSFDTNHKRSNELYDDFKLVGTHNNQVFSQHTYSQGVKHWQLGDTKDTNNCLNTIDCKENVTCCTSTENNLLIAGMRDNSLKIIDFGDSKAQTRQIYPSSNNRGSFRSLVCHENLLFSCNSGNIDIYTVDQKSKTILSNCSFRPGVSIKQYNIDGIVFWKDLWIPFTHDGHIYLYNPNPQSNGKYNPQFLQCFYHGPNIHSVVVWNNILISTGNDGTIKVWPLAEPCALEQAVRALRYAANKKQYHEV